MHGRGSMIPRANAHQPLQQSRVFAVSAQHSHSKHLTASREANLSQGPGQKNRYNDDEDMQNLIGASSQPAIINYLADEFFSEQYIRLPEEKIAKMFACMTVVGEALGEA